MCTCARSQCKRTNGVPACVVQHLRACMSTSHIAALACPDSQAAHVVPEARGLLHKDLVPNMHHQMRVRMTKHQNCSAVPFAKGDECKRT